MPQHSVMIEDESELEFPHLPPFPKDILIAPLLRVKLSKLLREDQAEINLLFKACRELGFFYLDVRGEIAGEELVGCARALFGEGQKVFDLPVEKKITYDLGSRGSHFGYKGYGAGTVDATGTKDRNEFFNVSLAITDQTNSSSLLTYVKRFRRTIYLNYLTLFPRPIQYMPVGLFSGSL